MKTFVIAEAGSCHDGQLHKALSLVDAARAAGADACKFQYWSDPNRLADQRKVPEIYRRYYRRYQLIPAWLPTLAEACAARLPDTEGKRPIEFMCSIYSWTDVATVVPFVRRLKIASFEADSNLTDRVLIEKAADLQIVVSTGMMLEPRLRNLVALRDRYYTSARLAILHCVSSYPAPSNELNLAAIERYRLDGFSDHSGDVRVGGLAVAAGASIIEAHLRLNTTNPENPDFATAFTPAEFAEYVRNIRFAEQAMGTGEKRLQECEKPMAEYRVR